MDVNQRIRELEVQLEAARLQSDHPPPTVNLDEFRDQTRAEIARMFTHGFFISVFAVLVILPIYNALLNSNLDIRELLLAVSSVLGTPFGFVIGYYFKGAKE